MIITLLFSIIYSENKVFDQEICFFLDYNKNDKLKKQEKYEIIKTIESYECEDKEHALLNISFLIYHKSSFFN